MQKNYHEINKMACYTGVGTISRTAKFIFLLT